MEPWNDLSVLPPPVNTCYSRCDVSSLLYECTNISNILMKQSPLHQESAILSRFIYKFDRKFRNDIGYRNLKKVNAALRKYLKLNLLHDIEFFISVIPNKDDYYLPTRQMLEYVLIRIISFSKIMLRICICSKKSAIFYMDRVKRGDSHWMSLMPYSLLSRIWSMCFVLLRHSCSWYSDLFQYLDRLQLKGLDFLPHHFKLTSNLEKFLDIKNIDNCGRFEWSQKKGADVDLMSLDDDADIFDNILNYVKEINKDDDCPKELETTLVSNKILDATPAFIKNFDQGKVISRDRFQDFSFIPRDAYKHGIVRCMNSLTQFIKEEEEYRNSNNKRALTSHLAFMQWQALKNSLVKLNNTLMSNTKIERKFQKIWKEKCLDYIL